MDTSKKISAQRGRCLGYTVTCASLAESKVPPCEGLQSVPGLGNPIRLVSCAQQITAALALWSHHEIVP